MLVVFRKLSVIAMCLIVCNAVLQLCAFVGHLAIHCLFRSSITFSDVFCFLHPGREGALDAGPQEGQVAPAIE